MGRDMCLTRVVGKRVVRWWGARGKLLITAWDFIKPRLSCAQCIVYYHPGSPSRLCAATRKYTAALSPLGITYQDVDPVAARISWPASFAKIERLPSPSFRITQRGRRANSRTRGLFGQTASR